ncbi:MAG: 3-methyl-2-oxobutanoate hydroxymethyltransferase [bacterium]
MYTAPQITRLKSKTKIVMLTAYDYLMASYLEKTGVDIILVGDSLGMVFLGYKDTLEVTVEDVIYHVKAVKRGATHTMIVADMPFMSYQESVRVAIKNAGQLMKVSGASAVKLEGGTEICPQIKALVKIGIPVMGHIGLQPQSVNLYGGYPVQGVNEKDIERLIVEAKALEKAGVFALVVEKVLSKTTALITAAVKIPVIGIGSGPHCDGQVLVTQDLLGAFEDFTPKFVKKYANVAGHSTKALKNFISDVRSKKFPSKKYFY